MARLAKNAWRLGDPLPDAGTMVLVSGANQDITSDQDRAYGESYVVGYSSCGQFICLQVSGCWPTVERLTNCWFAPTQEQLATEAFEAAFNELYDDGTLRTNADIIRAALKRGMELAQSTEEPKP